MDNPALLAGLAGGFVGITGLFPPLKSCLEGLVILFVRVMNGFTVLTTRLQYYLTCFFSCG